MSCLFFLATVAQGCGSDARVSTPVSVEDITDALSQDQFECEKTKRECLVAADCDTDKRKACEMDFKACEEPVRAEKDKVHQMCRSARESCDSTAADAAARHACHIEELRCTLPVEPPEAACHIDAEECLWAAHGMLMSEPPKPPEPMMMSDADKACHDTERSCRESLHLDPKSLPEPPRCPPPTPPECVPMDPATPPPPADTTATPATPAMTQDHYACERTKRECLIAADCDTDKRDACEAAFRSCDEPSRLEHERVHDMCQAAEQTCDAAAADEAAHHACHVQQQRCMLPVEPPEAVCHVDAEECIWVASGMLMPEPMHPMPHLSDADKACRDTEHACIESRRMHPEDLPEPAHCEPPAPPHCMPAANKP